jgi:hypothetical protein
MIDNPMSNVMSVKSKELLVGLLTSVLKDHVELVLREYIGMEMTTTMQHRLQLELDELVELWVKHNMVNEDFRLHANYVGEPPVLNSSYPIRRELVKHVPCPTGLVEAT